MDFEVYQEDTPEMARFRQEVRSWLGGNLPATPRPGPAENSTPEWTVRLEEARREFRRRLGAQGWLVPTWPKEFGGAGLSGDYAAIINEELARADAPPVRDQGMDRFAPACFVYGTDEQKRRWLTQVARGDVLISWVCTEPEAGSDLASLRTRGIRDGDEYIVSGSKHFISGVDDPDYLFTIVNTDPNAPRHENLSTLLIPATLPGITIQRMDLIAMEDFGGGQHFVYFDNVRVPAEYLVGPHNKGWAVANTTLEVEHGGQGSPGGESARESLVAQVIAYLVEAGA